MNLELVGAWRPSPNQSQNPVTLIRSKPVANNFSKQDMDWKQNSHASTFANKFSKQDMDWNETKPASQNSHAAELCAETPGGIVIPTNSLENMLTKTAKHKLTFGT